MKRKKQFIANLLLVVAWPLLIPVVVFAQTIPTVISSIGSILNDAVIPLIIGLAFVVFLWGVFKYITSASIEGKEGGRMLIIYGLIGLFVMLAAWGLVKIIIDTIFAGNAPATAPPYIPEIPGV